MKDSMWERADMRNERTLGGDDMNSLRSAMLRLSDGGKCEECKWQPGEVVTQRRRVLCRTCANVESACRNVEAIALRVQRQRQK